MKAVSLSPDIKVEIVEIGHQMNTAGLPKEFIAAAVSTAFEFEGVYDLLRMWADEDDGRSRDASCEAPPPQIRASTINAHGSHLR